MNEYVMLRITRETHKELTEIGRKSEQYDDIIKRLIDHYVKTGVKA